MRVATINKHEVIFYDSIEDMPSSRFHAYNLKCMTEAGIGSDLDSVDLHIKRIKDFVRHDNKGEALKELSNMQNNLYFISMNLSPDFMSFAALVKSIDGIIYDDLTNEGLQRVVEALEKVGFVVHHFKMLLNSVKKKSTTNLVHTFQVSELTLN